MNEFINPFSIDRAEQLGENLFRFFAYHKSFEGLLKHKSLIIEGGRGSGKTMFYLYHTYFTKKQEANSNKISFDDFLSNQELIGIHFRCDSNFVPAFQHKGISEEEWVQIFAHYLNISLSKRLVEIIIDINENIKSESKLIFKIIEEAELLLDTQGSINDFKSLHRLLKRKEIDVINYVNNSKFYDRPQLIVNGYFLNLIAKSILEQESLKKKTIHVFIDEYENLLPYQQKILNTLIKHPDPVIFDVGMRNEGHKTHETLSDSEIISPPHDYHPFNFEDLTDTEYEELLVNICEKRLETIECLRSKNREYFNIKYYLGQDSINDEVKRNFDSKNLKSISIKIKNRIGSENHEAKILYEVEDILLLRLNLVLLERGEKVDKLISEFKSFKASKESKYTDWIHNNQVGVLYLLLKESRINKTYAGFSSFKLISSGIIRYFLELCESAFKNANRNGFSFNNPRPLSITEQSAAAYYVSRYKVNDVETYTPNSLRLKRFVVLLGKIFQALNLDRKLSEPERNHFTTQYDNLSDESRSFIKNAILYSVLQVREKTKIKSSDITSDNREFHLNHIYAPYFQISPRRKRSLNIKHDILESLILGDATKAQITANAFVKDKTKDEQNQLKIDL